MDFVVLNVSHQMGFNMFCKYSQCVPQHVPNSIFFAQHCPLGAYIGEEPMLGLLCTYVWTSAGRFSNADPVLDPVLTVRID